METVAHMAQEYCFKDRVEAIVKSIPVGRVMTYGQIAALVGSPRAARQVGGVAHFGCAYLHTTTNCPYAQRTAPPEFFAPNFVESSSAHSPSLKDASLRPSDSSRYASKCEGCAGPELPWQRVVNKSGGLASGYPGGRRGHKERLEAEGVVVRGRDGNYRVDVEKLIWWPEQAKPADNGSESLDLREEQP